MLHFRLVRRLRNYEAARSYTPAAYVTRILADSDASVMVTIYAMYADTLYGIISRIVADDVVAKDSLQDAFVRVWTKRNTFDSARGTLLTWMLNIARNLAIDQPKGKIVHQKRSLQPILS